MRSGLGKIRKNLDKAATKRVSSSDAAPRYLAALLILRMDCYLQERAA
jgi:hypothetical protein